MDLTGYIGYTKDEVLKILNENNLTYSIVEFEDNKFFDTLLLVKFEQRSNGEYVLYFDRFKLNLR